MDVICQYQQIIIHGAANKGECVILAVKNIQLVYMAIKVVGKTKMHLVTTDRLGSLLIMRSIIPVILVKLVSSLTVIQSMMEFL